MRRQVPTSKKAATPPALVFASRKIIPVFPAPSGEFPKQFPEAVRNRNI
jgi:hypothetical protein